MAAGHHLKAVFIATDKKKKTLTPSDQPPAKKTKPEGKDAAAKSSRACPRPLGNLIQLLFVALYMST
jgi:hypothetical protein